MTQKEAKQVVEGFIPDCSKEYILSAWQFLIDDGSIWRMSRRYGELASCMIAAGTLERNAA